MDTATMNERMQTLKEKQTAYSEKQKKLRELKEEAYKTYVKETEELRAKLKEKESLFYAPVKELEEKMQKVSSEDMSWNRELVSLEMALPMQTAYEQKRSVLTQEEITSYERLLGRSSLDDEPKPANYGKPVGMNKDIYLYKFGGYEETVWIALYEGRFISYCSRPKSKYLGDTTTGKAYLGFKKLVEEGRGWGEPKEVVKNKARMEGYVLKHYEQDSKGNRKLVDTAFWTQAEAKASPHFEEHDKRDWHYNRGELRAESCINYALWIQLLNQLDKQLLKRIEHIDLTDKDTQAGVQRSIHSSY